MSSPLPEGQILNTEDAATYYYNRTSPTTQTLIRAMKTVALDPGPLAEQAKMHWIAQELRAGRYEVHNGQVRRKA